MKTLTNIFISVMLLTIIVGWDVAHTPAKTPLKIDVVKASDVVQPTPTPVEVHYPPIEEYIRLKFGVYADKAMQVLTDPKCHENRYLDPKAVNDNRTWGGIGRDRGIYQINDVFHPSVTDACAFDYKCNIDYAYRMFSNDDNSFRRWTCGKVLGI